MIFPIPIKKVPAEAETLSPVTTEIQVLQLRGHLSRPAGRGPRGSGDGIAQGRIEKALITTGTNDAIGYVCPSQAYDQGGL